MSITIKPLPFICLLLTLLIWLHKPAVASKPAVIVKTHGKTAEEAIAAHDIERNQTFRSHYETAYQRQRS